MKKRKLSFLFIVLAGALAAIFMMPQGASAVGFTRYGPYGWNSMQNRSYASAYMQADDGHADVRVYLADKMTDGMCPQAQVEWRMYSGESIMSPWFYTCSSTTKWVMTTWYGSKSPHIGWVRGINIWFGTKYDWTGKVFFAT